MIPLARPLIGEEEKLALNEVIDSGWITTGEKVIHFEKQFSELHSFDESIAVSSCTAGLHLCLAALGISAGDQVLVPSLTFVATVNAILYVGATPVFVDIESLDCPHISLQDAQQKITPKVKAAIIMHYAGYSTDTSVWRQFADQHNLVLIEDAAHAPGLEKVGLHADAVAFSFFGNKNMSTGEGGMVTAKTPEVRNKMRSMRSHGMTTSTLDRHKGHAFEYDVNMLGFNYRMDEMRAAMGICQLKKLPEWNRKRKKLSTLYRDLIAQLCPQILVPFNDNQLTVAHLFPVLLPDVTDRHQVMAELREAGIQSSIHYPPVHQFSFYQQMFFDVSLPKTEDYCKRVITLPLYPALDKQDVEKIVNALKTAL